MDAIVEIDADLRLTLINQAGEKLFGCRAELVREGEQVYGYTNSCPHTGGPLDWVPDQILSLDKQYIQCATHDALFRLQDGVCVSGPCAGERLAAVPVAVESGEVVLSLPVPAANSR